MIYKILLIIMVIMIISLVGFLGYMGIKNVVKAEEIGIREWQAINIPPRNPSIEGGLGVKTDVMVFQLLCEAFKGRDINRWCRWDGTVWQPTCLFYEELYGWKVNEGLNSCEDL